MYTGTAALRREFAMKTYCLLFLSLCISFSCLAQSSKSTKSVHSSAILADIKKEGCSKTLKRMPQASPEWQTVLYGIQTGFPDWVSIYAALSPCSKLDQKNDLEQALQAATANNPYLIFDVILTRSKETVSSICNPHFDQYVDSGHIKAYLDTLVMHLNQPRDQHDVLHRQQCLEGIKEARIIYNIK